MNSFASRDKSDLSIEGKSEKTIEKVGGAIGGSGLSGFVIAKIDASTTVAGSTTVIRTQAEQAMNGDGGLLGWVMAGVAAIVATLTSAVAALYKAQIGDLRAQLLESRSYSSQSNVDHKAELERLEAEVMAQRKMTEECARDREALRVSLARMEERQLVMECRVDKVESQVQKAAE